MAAKIATRLGHYRHDSRITSRLVPVMFRDYVRFTFKFRIQRRKSRRASTIGLSALGEIAASFAANFPSSITEIRAFRRPPMSLLGRFDARLTSCPAWATWCAGSTSYRKT